MRKNFIKQTACVLTLAMVATLAAPASTPVEAAAKMALNATSKTLYVGEKGFNFDVKNAPKGATQKWTISDSKVATVGSKTGFVTPKKNGKVTVKVTVAQKGKTPTVLKATVTVRTKASSVKITNLPEKIEVGETIKLGADVAPSTTSNKAVKWYVDSKAKATINWKTGELTGVKAGEKVKIACVADSNKTKAKATAYVEVVAATPKAKQLGAKTIQVDLNDKLVKDITVKKGDSVVTLDANDPISLTADGKSAIVKTASNMVAGEYTVEVKDVEAKAKFTAEASKFTKITVIGDKLVLDKNYGEATKAFVGYTVENQWGEDVSNLASIQATSIGTTTAQGGRVTVDFGDKSRVPMLGTTASLVLVETSTGLSTTATLTVAAKALPAEITVEGLYNANDKKLATDTNLNKDEFYVTFKAVDQYGNEIKDKDTMQDTVVVNVTDPTKVDFERNATGNTSIKVEQITVKGVKKLAIKAKAPDKGLTAGKTQVIFIPLGSGKSVTTDIEVLEKVEYIDTITLMAPENAVVGEDVIIPYTALNTYGNEVTSYDALSTLSTLSPDTFERSKDYATGKGVIILPASANTSVGMKSLSVMTKSYKMSNITFTVKDASKPVAIVGFSKDQKLAAKNGSTVEFNLKNLMVQDNYGRTKTGSDAAELLANYDVKISADMDASGLSLNSVSSVTIAKGTVKEDITIKNSKVSVDGDTATGYLTVEFSDKNGVVGGSQYTQKFTVVANGVKYESYKIDTADKLWAVTGETTIDGKVHHASDFKVIGVTASGLEVTLDDKEYQAISANDNVEVDSTSGKIVAKGDMFTKDDKSDATKEVVVTVVTSYGATIEKKVTVCNATPTATTLEFNADFKQGLDVGGISKMADGTWKVEVASGKNIGIDAGVVKLMDTSMAVGQTLLVVKDQYGKVMNRTGKTPISNHDCTKYVIVIENNDEHKKAGTMGKNDVEFQTIKSKEAKVTIMMPGGPSVKAIFVTK